MSAKERRRLQRRLVRKASACKKNGFNSMPQLPTPPLPVVAAAFAASNLTVMDLARVVSKMHL